MGRSVGRAIEGGGEGVIEEETEVGLQIAHEALLIRHPCRGGSLGARVGMALQWTKLMDLDFCGSVRYERHL